MSALSPYLTGGLLFGLTYAVLMCAALGGVDAAVYHDAACVPTRRKRLRGVLLVLLAILLAAVLFNLSMIYFLEAM